MALLDKVMPVFKQKRLGLEQSIIVVLHTKQDDSQLIAKSTLRELSQRWSLSQFGPEGCDLANPMVLVASEQQDGSINFPEAITIAQYEDWYGSLPAEIVED